MRGSFTDDYDSSPSPAASLDADGIDESGNEADAPAEEDDDAPLYPLEGKFLSSSDRVHVMSLPEIERESILAERAEEVSRRQQDLQLRKQLQRSQAAANKHKRKAAAAELEDGTRRSTRPKTEKASALDNYRRAREQKGAERRELESVRDRRDERSPSSASDRDADGESEVEWAEPPSDRRRDEPPAELRDFERCRLGRSNFSKVCFYPGFEDAIRGCFTRVSIGLNRETGQNQYRMTQIRGKCSHQLTEVSSDSSQVSLKESHTSWRRLLARSSQPTSTPSWPMAKLRSLGHSLPARTADLPTANISGSRKL